MFKGTLIFLFLAALVTVKASPLPSFTREEMQNLSRAEAQTLYQSYVEFFKQIERDSLYPLQNPMERKTSFKSLSRAFRFILSTAHAREKGSLVEDGQVCFFGGYESQITNGYCVHPRFIEETDYESCEGGEFRCQPKFFQKNTCIQINSYEHLTDKCYQKGKLSPEKLKQRLSDPFFQKLQRKVNEFCDRNPPYDACNSLRSVLQDFASKNAEKTEGDGVARDFSVTPREAFVQSEASKAGGKGEGRESSSKEKGAAKKEQENGSKNAEKTEDDGVGKDFSVTPREAFVESEASKVVKKEEEGKGDKREGPSPIVKIPEVDSKAETPNPSVVDKQRPQEQIDINDLPTSEDIVWRRNDPEQEVEKRDESVEAKLPQPAPKERGKVEKAAQDGDREEQKQRAHLDQRGILKGRVFNCHSNLMVRSRPTKESSWYGRLSCPKGQDEKGAKVEILDDLDNGWLKINYDGKEAYVSGKYVNLNHAVDFAHESLNKMKELNLGVDFDKSRCVVGGVRKEHCEHPEENGRKPSEVDENFMNSCTGRLDPPQTRMEGGARVERPQDYILSRAYETRDINGAGGNTDSTCAVTDWKRVENFLGIPDGEKVSIQDYIDYRCNLMKPGSSCRNANFGKMKRNYEGSLENLPESSREKLPTGDELVEYMGDLKFKDDQGNEVGIPRSLAMAMMYKESRGKLGANREGDDHGLFQINSDFHRVKKEDDGTVLGVYDDPPEATTYNKSSANADEKSSIYHPYSNTDKFVDIMRSKWNRLKDFFNGRNGRPDFLSFSSEQQWQFVLASYNGGENNIFNPYKRLKKFNQALKCNSCDAFSPQQGGCQALRLNCEEGSGNSCGEPLPVTFETIERFNNFTGHAGDPSYKKNLKCFDWQHMGRDQKGPCNVGVTFTYTRGMDSLQSCFEYEEGS